MREEFMKNLFVYGTLQQGKSRNHVLEDLKFEKAKLSNFCKIEPEKLHFPFIIRDENSEVNGEIYFDVNEDLLALLDRIEGEGSLYHRIVVKVETAQDREVQAFTYYPDENLIKNYT
jgi:gamma-glutamylcyclotransferase (GGCT)/AIG2-like uncharacterized protein YtfP